MAGIRSFMCSAARTAFSSSVMVKPPIGQARQRCRSTAMDLDLHTALVCRTRIRPLDMLIRVLLQSLRVPAAYTDLASDPASGCSDLLMSPLPAVRGNLGRPG